MSEPDIVLRGGRVIDPGSGLDAVQDVAITGGQVTEIRNDLPRAPADLNVAGLVVTAGTFARALRLLTRDGGPLGLAEALSKCSLGPARLLQDRVPAMRRKGGLQVGCDADIVVLDPATISDQASYVNSTRPSTGIQHVMVNGTFVVRDGNLVAGARPGRPIRADPR
jgi:N-acyl-D-aspartate/D-glutamate deacylase